MTNKINIEELKVMIANQIKNENLHDILNSTNIEEIAKNILNKQKQDLAISAIPDFIPEGVETPASTQTMSMPTPDNGDESIPTAKYFTPSQENADFGTGITNSPEQIDQSTTGNIPAYTPELPSFLDKIEPAKIIVFDYNELSEGGENLSHKPLRTFEDPDVKKSMNDLWVQDGKRKADVYIVKLEKVGNLEFNYTNGTTRFEEKRFDPDFEVLSKYKENPYAVERAEKLVTDMSNSAPVENAIELENVVTKVLMDLISKGITTNTVVPMTNATVSMDESVPGYAVNRLFKGDGDIEELNAVAKPFDLNMANLVDDNGRFAKAELPEDLKEHIGAGEREYLKNENQEVEEWVFNDQSYFLPKNRISKNKGYVFKN